MYFAQKEAEERERTWRLALSLALQTTAPHSSHVKY